METTEVIGIGREAIWTVIYVAGPVLLIALSVGLIIGVFQAATSIQEMTQLYPEACRSGGSPADFWRLAADHLVRNVHHDLRHDPANLYTMNLILDDVVQILATGLIPLLRISALLLAAPLVSLKVVSVRIRVAIALV